jgi:hypothetical protein
MKNYEVLLFVWLIVGGVLTATYKFNWFVGHDSVPVLYGVSIALFFTRSVDNG